LCLLDESVEQHHPSFSINVEQYARDPIVRQIYPDLEDAVAQRAANRHSNRPAKFNRLDVFSDSLPILGER